LGWFAAIAGALLLASALWDHHRLARAIRRRSVPSPLLVHYPSLTVIRPVRGLDVDAAINATAALDTGYPGEIETLFVLDDESDPALPVLRKVVAAHTAAGGGSARILFAGPPPAGRTGKLNAMIAGLSQARGELIGFGDSDTRPDRLVLRRVVEKLMTTPNAGAAFAPVIMREVPHTVGDAGVAVMMNGIYGPAVAWTARHFGDVPFIMGQLMVFRRQALADLGDLQNLSGELVDDMAIGIRLVALGWRNVISAHPLPIVVRGLGHRDFALMLRRWLIFSRSGLPARSFKLSLWIRGARFWVGCILALAALITGHFGAALLPAAVMLTVGLSAGRLHRALGGAPLRLRYGWIPFLLFTTAPIALVTAVLRPQVKWRGRTYQLDMRSRLTDASSTTPSRDRRPDRLVR
jgi:ceramide glucosyltransferase